MSDISYTVSIEKIRNTIKKDGRRIMEINIEYPIVQGNNEKSFDRINKFYSEIAEKYFAYSKKNGNRISESSDEALYNSKAYGEIMKKHIALKTEKYLSVVIEIIHFDGYFSKRMRFSQTWNVEKQIILPLSYFLKMNRETRYSIKRKIYNKIIDEIKKGDSSFSYTTESIKKYAGNVNPNNFFLCENGIAFWYDCGTLAPENEGFPTYIVPYKSKTELS